MVSQSPDLVLMLLLHYEHLFCLLDHIMLTNALYMQYHLKHQPKQANQQQQAQPRWVVACAWHWGAVAPWFGGATAPPMEREGAKLLEGRVAWLILLVVVSVCVVFCVLCFNWQPDNFPLFSGRIFIQFCNNWSSYFDGTDGYLRFISTISQTTVLFFWSYFFPVVIWTRRKT